MCVPRLHFSMYAASAYKCVRAPFSSQQLYYYSSNFKFKFHAREIKVEIRLLFKFPNRNLNLLTVILNLLCYGCVHFSVVTHPELNVIGCMSCVCVHLEKRQFFVQWVIRLMARVNGADASGTVGSVMVMRNAIKITNL